MESCGIDVFNTVRNGGWEIDVVRSERECPRFFGLVVF